MRVNPNKNGGPPAADRPGYVVSLQLECLHGGLPQPAVHPNVSSDAYDSPSADQSRLRTVYTIRTRTGSRWATIQNKRIAPRVA